MTWPERPASHTPDVAGTPDEPWLPRCAIDWLEANLARFDGVFEVGGGASTVWLAKRVKRVVTVEQSPEWATRIHEALQEENLSNAFIVLDCGSPPETLLRLIDPDRDRWLLILDGWDRPRWLEYLGAQWWGPILVDNAERFDCARAMGVCRECRTFSHGVPADGGIWRAELWE